MIELGGRRIALRGPNNRLGAMVPEAPRLGFRAPSTGGGGNVWTGDGPPADPLVGAEVGDEYVDLLTGDLYRLDPGV